MKIRRLIRRNYDLILPFVSIIIMLPLVYEKNNGVGGQIRFHAKNAFEILQFMFKQQFSKSSNDFDGLNTLHLRRCLFSPKFPTQQSNNNLYWQTVTNTDHMEIYLFSAYFDDRSLNWFLEDTSGVVQILAMIGNFNNRTNRLHCQIWDENNALLTIIEAVIHQIWIKYWDPRSQFYFPYIISCPLPSNIDLPRKVSLSFQPCQNTLNWIDINLNSVPKNVPKNHTVLCVKGMDFVDDITDKLIEWIELNLMFGASKIVIYVYSLHENVAKTLKYYTEKGNVEVIPLSLPGRQPNIPVYRSRYIQRNRQQKRRNELIPYNDCLYRHLYSHSYALIVDIDEVIVPYGSNENWADIIRATLSEKNMDESKLTALSVRNAFFFDNLTKQFDNRIPAFAHMLRHPYRSNIISADGSYGKAFMYIPNVLSVFNHYPLHKRLPGKLYQTIYVNKDIAIKHHYKANCPIESRDDCDDLWKSSFHDVRLLKRKDLILSRIHSARDAIYKRH